MGASTVTGNWVRPAAQEAQPASDLAAQQFEAEAMRHLPEVMRAANRLLHDRSRAEDVVQEVFLEAWKSFHRFEPGTNCRAWLYKILFHKVRHYRRKWFRLRLFSETEDFVPSRLAAPPPAAESLTDEDILAALDRVPHDFRAVILLVDIEEFSYKEAAGILGIPIGTVMSRLSRARGQLRASLAGVAQSYGFGKEYGKGINV
ncbi:MAG: sigma-70 family RNA polymerase sigma factor [Bryobacterales bacterium]|nr:sigma-70 family RNA polymerase sigma factor [Bryobacterales bacterium]